MTRTIDANSSRQSSQSSVATLPRQTQSIKDNSVKDRCHMDKRCGLQGIPWKDFSRDGFNLEKWDSPMRKISKKIYTGKQGYKSESVHKSRRVSKKRVMDQAFDDDEDAEIRYVEKLKNSKFNAGYRGNDKGSVKKYQRFSLVSGKSGKEGKKLSRSDDTDCEEEHGPMPDGEIDDEEKKKLRKQPVDAVADPKWEMNLTTRQRALQSGKDASASGGSMVGFPKGLPLVPRKKQKTKLSDVEQQLKKSEAAQRRRMQNEKAARESEAEAIRKIRGRDSNRKKREEKKKKCQEELAQETAVDALTHASKTITWFTGPTGATVTFPEDVGLPSIFDSKHYSYPPREKCAGPFCANQFKYRDSKTKLPLCSLQCYKEVQGSAHSDTAPAGDVPAPAH